MKKSNLKHTNRNQKTLPFNSNPTVDVYSLYASRFAIQSNYQELLPLLIINHLMLCYYSQDRWLDFNYGGYQIKGYVETDITDEIKESTNLIDYFINKIDSDHYLLLSLDHYFLQNTASYEKIHFMHDITVIYGYDKERAVFYLADNFDEIGKFKSIEASFGQIVTARRYVEANPPNKERLLAYSHYINLKDCYQFNLNDIIRVLNDYLTSQYTFSMRHTQEFTKGEKIFGIDIFGVLRKMLESHQADSIDMRAFHVLINHKAVLLMLIDYLNKTNHLYDYNTNLQNFDKILKSSIIMQNLIIKISFLKKPELFNRALKRLDELKQKEISVIHYLLKSVKYL